MMYAFCVVQGERSESGEAGNCHLKPSRPRSVPARPKKCTSHVRGPLRFPKKQAVDEASGYSFDCFLPALSLVVEFDGPFHFAQVINPSASHRLRALVTTFVWRDFDQFWGEVVAIRDVHYPLGVSL